MISSALSVPLSLETLPASRPLSRRIHACFVFSKKVMQVYIEHTLLIKKFKKSAMDFGPRRPKHDSSTSKDNRLSKHLEKRTNYLFTTQQPQI